MDFDRFLDLLRALETHAVDYMLVGGVAVNVHGIVRATEDVDLFVRSSPENLERLKAALRSLWEDPEIDEIRPEDLVGDYATLRYGTPDGALVIDVLTRIGDAFEYDDLAADTVEIEGVRARVADPATLVRMKEGTVRPIDRADAAALRAKFGLEER